jgi:hypothetical protein
MTGKENEHRNCCPFQVEVYSEGKEFMLNCCWQGYIDAVIECPSQTHTEGTAKN